MRRLGFAAVVFVLAVYPAAGQAPAPAPPPIVLENVTVIDGTGAPPRPATTIVVADGRIAAIFPTGAREAPAEARRLAGDGLFVMPGLIDTHVHLAMTERPGPVVDALLAATLTGGVTTVRDMGGNGAILAPLRDAARERAALSPDIRVAAVFAGPDSVWFRGTRVAYLNGGMRPGTAPWLVRVDAATDIRAAVARAKAWGAAGLTLHSDLTARQVEAITTEGRRQQLPVWSRSTVGSTGPADVANARVTSMSQAHALIWAAAAGVLPPYFGTPAGLGQALARVAADDGQIRALLARMRERGVMLEPALYAVAEAAAFAGADRSRYDRQLAWAAAVTGLANEEGVPILAGTEAIGGSSPNIHAELQLLVYRAGLTPLEAIRAATFDAARALGIAGEVGSVIEGRRADLVVLDADPSADIRNTLTVRFVIKDGVVHERKEPMPVPPLAEPASGRSGSS